MPDTIQNTIQQDTTMVLLPDTTATKPAEVMTDDSIKVEPITVDTNVTPLRESTHTDTTYIHRNTPQTDSNLPGNQETFTATTPNQTGITNNSSSQTSVPESFFEFSRPYKEIVSPTDTVILENETFFTVYDALPEQVYGFSSYKNENRTETQFFTESVLGVGDYFVAPTHKSQWLDGVALGLIFYFTLVLIFTRRFTRSVFTLLVSPQKTHKQFEEDSQSYSYSRRQYIIPSILVISVYLLFAFQYIPFELKHETLFKTFIQLIIIMSIIYLCKQILFRTIGFITLNQAFISELIFTRQIVIIAATILLLPVSVLLPLYHQDTAQEILLIIGFTIIVSAFVCIILRSLMLFHSSKTSLFLWILYLCILEIAPYLALIVSFSIK